jgi:hypothetical protein
VRVRRREEQVGGKKLKEDKKNGEIFFLSFQQKIQFCIFSYILLFFKLCAIEHDAGSYRTKGRGLCKMEREREASNTHRRPRGGMPVSLLLSNLQEWKDRACQKKKLINTGEKKKKNWEREEREICFRRNSNGSQEKNFYQMVL